MKEHLENIFQVKDKGLKEVIEEVKQRVVATLAKLNRFEAWTEQHVENIMIQSPEKEKRHNDIRLGSQENKRFWGKIWDPSDT